MQRQAISRTRKAIATQPLLRLRPTQMAALLPPWLPSVSSSAVSPNPSCPLRLYVCLPTLFRPSLSAAAAAAAAAPRIRRPSSVAVRAGEGADLRIPDEWGDKSEPDAELPSAPDPPIDEDEWGAELGPAKAGEVGITDEWGEKADPEVVEAPSLPDPPKDDDEWGAEAGFLSGNGSLVPADDKLGDLKRCLVDSLYGKELGLRATLEDRAEILELVNQLEAANPIKAPTEALDLLDGNWILL